MGRLGQVVAAAGLLAVLVVCAAVVCDAPARAAGAVSAPPGGTCDLERGRRVFGKCAICHVRQQGQPARVAPNLYGVVGRNAGTAAGFGYSRAMRSFGRRWTREELDRFLASPTTAVPGTAMAFAGLRNPADRAAVICLLEHPGP